MAICDDLQARLDELNSDIAKLEWEILKLQDEIVEYLQRGETPPEDLRDTGQPSQEGSEMTDERQSSVCSLSCLRQLADSI